MSFCIRLLFALVMLPPLVASDGDVLPYPLHKDHLDNGLQVVTVPFDSPGLVTYYMVVRVGSREEVEPGVTGFAHFFEHVMFRGTERFSPQQFSRKLQEAGGGGNATTWLDRTVYYTTGNADKLETLFDIESDRFQNLKYSEHAFKTEAGAVLGEYTKNFANPYRRYYEKLQDIAFKKHTYGHTTMGYIADIKDMPNQYDYSLTFYDRFYRPEYCTLMVVGDTNHETVMKLSKKYFGNWKRGNYKPEIPVEPEQTEERIGHLKYDGNTSLVGVFYRGMPFSDTKPDKIALDLGLQSAFSSRSDIYKKLVTEEQKVRSISVYSYDTRDPFLVGVFARLYNVEDTPYVREALMAELEKLKTQPVDAKALEELKSRERYGAAAGFDTPLNVASNLAGFVWLTGDPDSLNRYYRTLSKMTPADIQASARKYLVKDKRIQFTLSGEETAR